MSLITRRSHSLIKLSTSVQKLFSTCANKNPTRAINVPPFVAIRVPRSHFCSTHAEGRNLDAITKGDKDMEHKLKVLMLEVEVMRQEGRLVPEEEHFKDHHWQELLNLPTFSSRRRYLEFQFKLSKTKENRLMKKEHRRAEYEQNKPEKLTADTFEEFASTYNLSNNTIFLRFYESTMNQMYNNKLVQAMQFGQKLVVDCGYDQQMTLRENKNCAKQLMLLFSDNRYHDDPFDIHFCNTNPNTNLMQTLHRHMPPMYETWFPLNIHETSYLEVFPKDQLVYLTPHCREELVEYDHDAVYIIGGIVDKINNEPLSLAKAKREGLKMAKLPLDRYLQWGSGSGKSLTLNQVISILLDVKATGDWGHALRHVPRRKLEDFSGNQTWPPKKKWTPKVDTENSKFSDSNSKKPENRSRRMHVRSIMYD